ncbi:MAG: hypothetical protein QW063_00495 [Candidatus Nanoarchaeia archaeon]
MMSQKGQLLAFLALGITLALIFISFTYTREVYNFSMFIGNESAHLINGYAETESAKLYLKNALRQAAYEAIYQQTLDKSCNFTKACSDKEQLKNLTRGYFEDYLSMYISSTELLEVTLPNYLLELETCNNKTIMFEAFGFSQGCILRSDWAWPELPCEDQNITSCNTIKFTNGRANACVWNATTKLCEDSKPAPDCESITKAEDCNGDCKWQTSYNEQIHVYSPSGLANYQFDVASDAHFITTINCAQYEAFAAKRV